MITHILMSWFKTFDSKQKTQETQKDEELVFQRKEAVVRQVFCEEDVLGGFAGFRGEHMCRSLIFNKVPGLRLATLLRETQAWVFSYGFGQISENTFFYRPT